MKPRTRNQAWHHFNRGNPHPMGPGKLGRRQSAKRWKRASAKDERQAAKQEIAERISEAEETP